MMIINVIFVYLLVTNIQIVMSEIDADVDLDIDNAWDFITNNEMRYENCPRCDSVPECYAECNKDSMKEFNNIKSWSQCQNKCVHLGGKYAWKFERDNSNLDINADVDLDLDNLNDIDADVDVNNEGHPDRACAMYKPNNEKCICVKGNVRACQNIGSGMQNCPNCGNSLDLGIIGSGAPECLNTCRWELAREFNDIFGWDNCQAKCQTLGPDFRFNFNVDADLDDLLNLDRGCAVYATYNNHGNKGKCVCFPGRHRACLGTDLISAADAVNVGNIDAGNAVNVGDVNVNDINTDVDALSLGNPDVDLGSVGNVGDIDPNLGDIDGVSSILPAADAFPGKVDADVDVDSDLNKINADVDAELELDEAWDFIDVLPITSRRYENCPRCDSISECYAECDKDKMMEFKNIASWSQCQDTCINLGGKYAWRFYKSDANVDIDADIDLDRDLNGGNADVDINNRHPDRACAMYRPSGKCICVQGGEKACKNMGRGMQNCPNCGNSIFSNSGIFGGAPECLSTCQWKYAREFENILGWDECTRQCELLGGDFEFKVDVDVDVDGLNSDKACAIYARYNNQGDSGKCVCIAGKHDACVGDIGDIDNVLSDPLNLDSLNLDTPALLSAAGAVPVKVDADVDTDRDIDEINADVDANLEIDEAWDFIDILPITSRRYENCPRCDSISECYAECNKDSMMEFRNIESWSECQDTCINLGGSYAWEFRKSALDFDIDADVDLDRELNGGDADVDVNRGHPDRACAMYRPSGKCICVKGNENACRNIGRGMQNCPNCRNSIFSNGGIFDSSPECLSTCQWKYAQEFDDIFGWDQCTARCNALGGDYRFDVDVDVDGINSDPGCAIYARYNNQGDSGKCVCIAGRHDACVGNIGDIDNVLSDPLNLNSPAILSAEAFPGKIDADIDVDRDLNEIDANVDADLELDEAWDFIDVLPITSRRYENCPRCDSISECYAECDKDEMMEFKNINSWSQCQDTCMNLGGKWSYKFKKSNANFDIDADVDLDRDLNGGNADIDVNKGHPDRACAMYRPSGKCICVKGDVRACKNVGRGKQNCPNCGNAIFGNQGILGGGAPECLSTCQWKYAQEFNDVLGWDECTAQCNLLGGDYRLDVDVDIDGINSDPGCAIYANYDNQGKSGKCVCVAGKHSACVGNIGDIDNVLSDPLNLGTLDLGSPAILSAGVINEEIDADIDADVDVELEEAWDFIDDLPILSRGYQNCPRCDSVPECYAECNKRNMKQFIGISSWSECKNTCSNLGGNYAYRFLKSSTGLDIDVDIDADVDLDDRACAMLRPNGKCICVEGNVNACINIGRGMENCPNCGNPLDLGIIGGAPECLSTCNWEFAQELNDILSWDECSAQCKSLGPDFSFNFGIDDPLNLDRGCAVYAKYNNRGNKGKCVCFAGKHNACIGSDVLALNAPPAILPVSETVSYEMIEGYGVGVVSTLIVLLIGIMMAYLCRKYDPVSKQYAKVNFVDSEDEQIEINA